MRWGRLLRTWLESGRVAVPVALWPARCLGRDCVPQYEHARLNFAANPRPGHDGRVKERLGLLAQGVNPAGKMDVMLGSGPSISRRDIVALHSKYDGYVSRSSGRARG
jgi:hypothetical protein